MDFVEQLKASIDIVKVIGEYLPLKRAGGSRYTGLCPFHSEKTPSFSVHSTRQFYYCFGCQAKGDAIRFVMEMESLTFPEALRALAERYGIPMPRRAEYSDAGAKLRIAVQEMHEVAAKAFSSALASAAGAEARAYLAKRGVNDALIAEFRLGYAERSGQSLVRRLEQAGFDPAQIEQSGLALKRQDSSGMFDRFRNRLMFPIQNESGKVIAFAGRALAAGDEPKYLNSPETPVYHKSAVLYNLHRAKDAIRKRDRSILVEGYMDVIGVYGAGIREVVASCGTALTNGQVRALGRHSRNIVVNFDPDAAGSQAAERSIQMLLEEDMHIRVLELDGGLDPDEYVKTAGPEGYAAKLAAAGSYFHWLADRARARHDMRTAEGRIAAFQVLLPAIQRMSDRLERLAIANDVAGYLGVPAGAVLDQFRRAAADRREGPRAGAAPEIPAVEKLLLHCLFSDEKTRSSVLPRLRQLPAVENFTTRPIFAALFALDEAGQPAGFSAVEGRLEEGAKSLLAAALFADEIGDEMDFAHQAEQCLKLLEASDHQTRVAGLRARVKEAERAGDLSEALRLTEELNRLARTRAAR